MPFTFPSGNTEERRIAESLITAPHFEYEYPRGLDLDPTKMDGIHHKLLNRILRRAEASYSEMEGRHDTWRKIKDKLVMYVPKDEKEQEVVAKDNRKPVSVVIPLLYSLQSTVAQHRQLL